MLELKNVFLSYDQNQVLNGLSIQIQSGEIVGIIGDSGIGKTSVLKLMSGYVDATRGEVLLNGKTIKGPSDKLVPGYEDIQLVNQDFGLDIYQSIYENVKGKILHLKGEDQEHLINDILELVELIMIKSRLANVLSGGEKQRLSLARALVCEPKYLLLDEPFVHVDQRLRLNIINYLLRLNEIRDTTIIIVSHDGAELMGFVDRMIHIHSGKVIRDDNPKSIFYHPETKDQAELLGIINIAEIDGTNVLFRTNEFSLKNGNSKLNVSFIRSINTGILVLNYFETLNGESIVLSSNELLDYVETIYIHKR